MCSFCFHFLLVHMKSQMIQATESPTAKPSQAGGQEAEQAADAANAGALCGTRRRLCALPWAPPYVLLHEIITGCCTGSF